jgi:hypothetical protein
MRKLFVSLVALAVFVALAVPAGAGRPTGKGKASLEVAKEASPGWAVHAAGDVITYTVEVGLGGDDEVGPVSVVDPAVDLTFVSGDTDGDEALDPGETWIYTGADTVTESDLALEQIVNTVTDKAGNLTASATATVEVRPYDTCQFVNGLMEIPGDPSDYRICVWDPDSLGPWQLTGVVADAGKRFVNAQLTVRDYVPGDWCGVAHERLRAGAELNLIVTLPADGACPGDEWADATPATFYLATMGLKSAEASSHPSSVCYVARGSTWDTTVISHRARLSRPSSAVCRSL